MNHGKHFRESKNPGIWNHGISEIQNGELWSFGIESYVYIMEQKIKNKRILESGSLEFKKYGELWGSMVH